MCTGGLHDGFRNKLHTVVVSAIYNTIKHNNKVCTEFARYI